MDIGLVIGILIASLGWAVVRYRRSPGPAQEAALPESKEHTLSVVELSRDGRSWWSGNSWQPNAIAVDMAPGGGQWWDGAEWQVNPSAPHPNLLSIRFDCSDLEQFIVGPFYLSWMAPDAIEIALQHFPIRPDLAGLDVSTSRASIERIRLEREHCLEDTVMAVDGMPVERRMLVFRIPAQAGGSTTAGLRRLYLGSLTFPFAECSWLITVQGQEIEPTGSREAAVTDRLLAGVKTKEELGLLVQTAREEALQERWDNLLPSDPLTLVRRRLSRIQDSLSLSEEVRRLAPFRA